MVSNQDLIKAVFDDKIYKINKWFFTADWKKAEVVELETKLKVLKIKNIIWYNGTWICGFWFNGIWEKGTWIYGWWYGGTWNNGTWKNGKWYKGVWKSGKWVKGKIYDSKKNEYIESAVPPNECKWSLSYGK